MENPVIHRRPIGTLSFAAGLIFTILIWAVDYLLLGPVITFTLMYLIPIAWVTWFSGRRSGYFLAFISTAGWATVYITQNPYAAHPWGLLMNGVIKLILYMTYAYVFSALHASLKREKALSRKDPLTGASNRRDFMDALESEKNRSSRGGHPLTLVFFDIDNFKSVNDSFGHVTGDRLLRLTAETIHDNLRITDSVARMGGDEFAILLSEIDPPGAKAAVEKIYRRLLDMAGRWNVTFSFGVITCSHPEHTPAELIAAADHAMYGAKQAGKNRVHFARCAEKKLPVLS